MEAIGEFIPDRALSAGPAMASGFPRLAAVGGAAGGVGGAVDAALSLLRAAVPTAVADAAGFGLREAADFAGRAEEMSRTLEYLQLIAAAAVDRTRKLSAGTPPAGTGWGADPAAGWLTGWTQNAAGSDAGVSVSGAGPDAATGPAPSPGAVSVVAADDGYRNAADFLRARLRISAVEARRRLALATDLLPRTGAGGHTGPPVREELAEAVASGAVASRAATIVTTALDRVRHLCLPETAASMEHALTMTAIEDDPDFLVRTARRWTDVLDQDGAEPSEEVLRRLQGAFIRKPRHGLHHLEIFATADQFEQLVTVMNTAANPRTGPDTGAGKGAATDNGNLPGADVSAEAGDFRGVGALDQRTRPQRLLDGLVGGCEVALATGGLPAAGGLRPQVMASIDYRDLLGRLSAAGSRGEGTGSLMFTGPITASTVRKMACDADIIPVLLGGEGRILDIGRASRVFPPHVRKALTARDQGCAFPQCTIPAAWCEAHHIDYWSRGGSTGTENGTLLCSHHHHLIHKEQWSIQMRSGIPWFVPPPHIDPGRVPRRNRYFRPDHQRPGP